MKRAVTALFAAGLLVGVAGSAMAHPLKGPGSGQGSGAVNGNGGTNGNGGNSGTGGNAGGNGKSQGSTHGHKGKHKGMKINTKLEFSLDQHSVTLGDTLTGTVHLSFRDKTAHEWAPFAGQTLSVLVDGAEVIDPVTTLPLVLTTDANGDAALSYVTDTEGGHVMSIVYAGDDTYRGHQRSQGFEVQPAPVV